MNNLEGRLERIAQAHTKAVDEHGGTYGRCVECDWAWPCPTYWWATTPVADTDGTWNPKDNDAQD